MSDTYDTLVARGYHLARCQNRKASNTRVRHTSNLAAYVQVRK